MEYRIVYRRDGTDEALEHHGIKGQKWGVRRFQDEKGRLTYAGKERYNTDISETSSAEQKKKRTVLKIGAVTAGTLIAAYAAYKFVDSGELHRMAEKGKSFLTRKPSLWSKKPDLADSTMDANSIFTKVVSRINSGGAGSTMNCRRCTFAYEMSRRGFDVAATKSLSGTGQNGLGLYNAISDNPIKGGVFGFISRAFKDPTTLNRIKPIAVLQHPEGMAKGIFETLSSFPDRARGELTMHWKESGAGHSMAWEIINRKPIIYDCQSFQMWESPESFKDIANHIANAGAFRLDNKSLNYDFLLKWVKNFEIGR